MDVRKRTRRRLLSAGVGVAAFTAVEGLACGNPLEPRCPDGGDAASCEPIDAKADANADTATVETADDTSDASLDTTTSP